MGWGFVSKGEVYARIHKKHEIFLALFFKNKKAIWGS